MQTPFWEARLRVKQLGEYLEAMNKPMEAMANKVKSPQIRYKNS